MRTDCVIKLSDLPLRAQELKEEDLVEVFGGCKGHHKACAASSDCCGSMTCVLWCLYL